MADPKLVEILKQGSEVWNRWRKQQPDDMQIDLSRANLSRANLNRADLGAANLFGANLFRTNLSRANLHSANLSCAELSEANLSCANLRSANLRQAYLRASYLLEADLSEADLSEADLFGVHLRAAYLHAAILRGADLSEADLFEANLSKADLSQVRVQNSILSHLDLRKVKGLSEVHHIGPSRVELYSIQLPQDDSALHFLLGCGVPDEWIDFWRSTVMYSIQYYSCFISYSSKDETLARRLHADLQAQGVRCWFAPHDMKIGVKIRPVIDQMIHQQDKLLLILSEHSVVSDWVEHEVETALAREHKEKRTILFPIRLDNAILEREHTGWAALVQNERHIGDFTNWTDPQAYNQAFDRLLHDLKAQN